MMDLHMINSEAELEGKKMESGTRLLWIKDDSDKEALSDAFVRLGKPKTAKSIQKGYVYAFKNQMIIDLRESGKLEEKLAHAKPEKIEEAVGLKVYQAADSKSPAKMKVYDVFPLAIFKKLKDSLDFVGSGAPKKKC